MEPIVNPVDPKTFLPEEFVCPIYVKFKDEAGDICWGVFEYQEQKQARVIEGSIIEDWKVTDAYKTVQKLMAPIPFHPPPAIYGMALNYRAYVIQIKRPIPKYPVIFMKNPCAVTHPNDYTYIPKICQDPSEAFIEMEIAVILKKTCKDVTPEEAAKCIFGYTICNDCSSKEWQNTKGSGQWSFSKSFDTFLPMGPGIIMQDDFDKYIKDHGFQLMSYQNGTAWQNSNSKDMMVSFSEFISFASQGTTLMAGTIFLTGTPGNNPSEQDPPIFLEDGDKLEFKVPTIGTLHNSIKWV